MGKGVKITVIIVVVAVLAGGIAWALGSSNTPKTTSQANQTDSDHATPENKNEASNPSAKENSDEPVAATISYNGNGFIPEVTTVKSGSKVKVVNNSNNPLDFGSDPHPTHTDNPELNAGDIDPSQSKTFTVTTKGNWGFHNHFNPSNHGFIKVE